MDWRRLSYATSESGRCPLSARAFATFALRPRKRVRAHARLELLAQELVQALFAMPLDRVAELQLVRFRQEPIEGHIEGHLLDDLEGLLRRLKRGCVHLGKPVGELVGLRAELRAGHRGV